ncbi:4Fe-4S binding protein [Aestuariirhabdus litorea]|uniref:4Fe-4S dicluster domain-containing protein n=1 Tax=Aestuariirhabdus litorea TaxID=2528527 RepID=A0A3P3VMH8_9GAMM|nr:4Fe-4S binding protein [Aestuariirhabdus litorea]RRJ82929.1 4Fe-4S dicluster domain-containing protein [Aestuariirhabdus litorea]RWW93088.1 4Fe-4S dicluster domain-containing protein [Endozoicomonadaceae bacterium GTF-13]
MALKIIEDECISCGDCVPECPTESITESLVAFKIKADSCTECEGESDKPKCVLICPIDDCIIAA